MEKPGPSGVREPEQPSARELAGCQPVEVVYLVVREGLSGVFDAQVLRPLSKHGAEVRARVVLCEPIGSFVRTEGRRAQQERGIRASSLGVDLATIPSAPARAKWLWDDWHLLRRWLRRRFGPADVFVLHARGGSAALLALGMRRWFPHVRVIFDCRGAEPAEQEELLALAGETRSRAGRRRLRDVQWTERVSATQSDHVLCVSNAMADYLSEQYAVQADRVTVVPCCVDTDMFGSAAHERDATRRELNVADRIVVAYCGSLEWYQCPDESLHIFGAIKALRPNAHFLALTRSVDRMRQFCKSAGFRDEHCTVLSLGPAAVPRYLAAADVGLLPRQDSLVNRVASPVKFAEYLASGTPVILSNRIGDYSELARSKNVGLVLPSSVKGAGAAGIACLLNGFLDQYAADGGAWRRRCQRVAQESLDWNVHLPRVAAVYDQVSKPSYGGRSLDTYVRSVNEAPRTVNG